MNFFALSQAPPALAMKMARRNPVTRAPASNPPRASTSIRPTSSGRATANEPGMIISRNAPEAAISTQAVTCSVEEPHDLQLNRPANLSTACTADCVATPRKGILTRLESEGLRTNREPLACGQTHGRGDITFSPRRAGVIARAPTKNERPQKRVRSLSSSVTRQAPRGSDPRQILTRPIMPNPRANSPRVAHCTNSALAGALTGGHLRLEARRGSAVSGSSGSVQRSCRDGFVVSSRRRRSRFAKQRRG